MISEAGTGKRAKDISALVSKVTAERRQGTHERISAIGDERFEAGKITASANEKGLKLIKKEKADILGKTLWEVFPQTVGSIFEKEYQRAVKTGETVSFESRHFVSDKW